ncbi:MAG: hypothetical protein NVSMB46_00770 [Candidatus Saccharimonadales bacterium]
MAADLITPVDHIAGLPLPIIPYQYNLPLNNPEIADPHHAFHPERAAELKTVAGLALRNSRLQITAIHHHNFGERAYHRFFKGPILPTNEQEIFARCVLACAGIIPHTGIDLRTEEPVVRPLSKAQYSFLQTPHPDDPFSYKYILYRYDPINAFFKEYVLSHNPLMLNEVNIASTCEEFLGTRKAFRKAFLGHLLIKKTVELATDDLRSTYQFARQNGLLHPLMPGMPQTLVKHKLGNVSSRTELIETLETKLRQQLVA